jgi:hypothetical protein
MVFVKSAPVLVFAALLSGCSGFGAISLPGFGGAEAEASNQPAPGNAAPAGVVETTELPPLVGQSEGADPFLNPDTQVAAASPWPPTDPAMTAATPGAPGELALTQTPPAAGGLAAGGPGAGGPAGEIARPDLLGAWTLTDGTESCELFMTLTTWTGGYRASTRGCTSTTLASISAWDLNGQQVVLAGPEGVAVARLYSSGMNRFDGQTETEAATVSFFR